ncbi:MAG: hypothetical protein DI563_18355 [Variovorax paradoxus]|uniref:Histidine kinase n=1 Tax=Variovorax paradoxus TaxID=34073 RepID=A0A2W5Q069_VARPD|nr:MAG: hypothetical protein DI563_18355 [Variovorax paradoxus]
MKASPSARSWIAAGVRHELLMRALPGLRHDMASPVSLIRMSLLMLRRQVSANPPDVAACEQRVGQVDEQLGMLIASMRALRDWELGADDEGVTRTGLVQQCTGLMRAAFDLNGIALELDPAFDADEAEAAKWHGAAALRYLMLGALCHLHDSAPEVGLIHVAPEGDAGVSIRAEKRPGDSARPEMVPHRAPRSLAIDAVSLQSLADDLGHAVRIARESVHLDLRAG